jgi:hypothetical protein
MLQPIRRLSLVLAAGVLLTGGLFIWAPQAQAAEGQQCFAQTGKCINPLFSTYWQDHGGLAINGYPISDEIVQNLENGQPYTVQYFERARFEYHPESDKDNRILLGQFGRQLHPADPPVAAIEGSSATSRYFAETGHNVRGDFFSYWINNGALAQFGYPITEPMTETIDGMDYRVQYFERARFEMHPENAAPYNVLLGQFGRRIYANTSSQVVAPCNTGTLRADLQMMAGAGARDGNIHLINTSNASCSLNGAPQVQVLDQNGAPLPVTITGPQGVTTTVGIAAAGRGQMISVPVRWTNYCGTDPGKASILLTLPDGGQVRVTNGVSVPPCLGETPPSNFTYEGFTSGPQAEAAANVIMGYFGAINAKDHQAAYAALGAALQSAQPYADFAAGYATTLKVEPSSILISGSTQQTVAYQVTLNLSATQADGSVKNYKGTYSLATENGTWKIVAADVAQQ